jgi:1,4-alpha-glucan branching enzyme
MTITKNFLKTRASCKVRFQLSAQEAPEAESVFLVGDFNDWNNSSHPMKRLKEGGFSLEIELPLGLDCQFRYLTDTGVWLNDTAADAYVPCTFAGVQNSLVKV